MNKKELAQERRARHIENLITEAVVNVIAEQDMMNRAVPNPTPGPAPETNQMDPDIQNPIDRTAANPEPEQFSVDTMVDKLNVLRGGRSFTDPEVFGRLTTFFNGLTDEQRTSMDWLLTELGKVVIDASEEQVDPDGQQQQQNSTPPQQQQQRPPQQGQQQPGAQAPVMPTNGGM